MSEPFIAPAGAMQFEVLRGGDGGEVPEKYRPYLIWVRFDEVPLKRKTQKPDCPHEFGYEVITHNRLDLTGNIPGKKRVCECVGRLIE